MKIRISHSARMDYWYLDRRRSFVVTSKDRWNYYVRSNGIDNMYKISKNDCEIVKG
ncbi:MAG: hypothetical protein HYV29_01660 [Ignavibacteriales bacterium]|nr:hypothetical protein [Ignavibacteriales bacterium]